MAERVAKKPITREEGFLYYLGKDGYLWKVLADTDRADVRARVGDERITRQDGYMYFLDKEGYVSRAKMREPPPTIVGTACKPGPYRLEVGEFEEIPLNVEKGERVRGRLFELDGQDFDWFIVDQKNSILFRQREGYDYEDGGDHVSAASLEWRVRRTGPWFLELEIPYRQNTRSIRVELKRETQT
jgi:hypothetical protein